MLSTVNLHHYREVQHLAEVERALVISPPAGKEKGWVAIPAELSYPVKAVQARP